MFVAYTGYGRIATMGEEVRDPHQTIPKAIITTLVTTMVLYMAVAFVGVGVLGSQTLAEAATSNAAPLEAVAYVFWLVINAAVNCARSHHSYARGFVEPDFGPLSGFVSYGPPG